MSFIVSRMIEESGNKRKTMAEKRQLFLEMREFPQLRGPCSGVQNVSFHSSGWL